MHLTTTTSKRPQLLPTTTVLPQQQPASANETVRRMLQSQASVAAMQQGRPQLQGFSAATTMTGGQGGLFQSNNNLSTAIRPPRVVMEQPPLHSEEELRKLLTQMKAPQESSDRQLSMVVQQFYQHMHSSQSVKQAEMTQVVRQMAERSQQERDTHHLTTTEFKPYCDAMASMPSDSQLQLPHQRLEPAQVAIPLNPLVIQQNQMSQANRSPTLLTKPLVQQSLSLPESSLEKPQTANAAAMEVADESPKATADASASRPLSDKLTPSQQQDLLKKLRANLVSQIQLVDQLTSSTAADLPEPLVTELFQASTFGSLMTEVLAGKVTLEDPNSFSVLMLSNPPSEPLNSPKHPTSVTLKRSTGHTSVLTLQTPPILPGSKRIKKHKLVTDCPHSDEPYYSKGMCRNCYHARGRKKPSTACEHSDRPNYALGLCKNCYLKKYHRNRKSTAVTSAAADAAAQSGSEESGAE